MEIRTWGSHRDWARYQCKSVQLIVTNSKILSVDLKFGNESNLEPLSHLVVNSSKAESTQKYCKTGNIHAQEIFSNFTKYDSLRSEICRTHRIQVGRTHPKTNKNHYNASPIYEASRKPYSGNFSTFYCVKLNLWHALWWSQFVLGWVQRNLNFGSSDIRLWWDSHIFLLMNFTIREY